MPLATPKPKTAHAKRLCSQIQNTRADRPFLREGKIVPAEVTVGLLRKAMEKSGKSRFLIDGFPRNPDNLAAWEASTAGGAVVFDFALFLDCPEEVCVEPWWPAGGGLRV